MFGCLFSFRGGSGRAFLLGAIFFWTCLGVAAGLLGFIFSDTPYIGSAAAGLVSILSFFSLWAVYVRRIHDLGASGWWVFFIMLVTYVPYLGIWIYDQLHHGEISKELMRGDGLILDETTLMAAGILIVTSVISLIFSVVLLCLPGKHTENEYILG